MRHRAALLSVVALTLFGAGACGKPDEPAAGSPTSVAVSGAAASGAAAPGASAAGLPRNGSAASPGAAGNQGGGPVGATRRPGGGPPAGAAPGKPGGGPVGKPGGTSAKPGTSATTLTATGLGPYQVAVKRTALASAGVLGKVDTSKGCTDFVVAKGTSKYHAPTLVFYQGKLQYTSVTSTAVATGKGARVGTSYADVKNRHADGKELTDWLGAPAWFVTSGSNALLFRLKNGKVHTIEAGVAEPLQFRYTDGEGC